MRNRGYIVYALLSVALSCKQHTKTHAEKTFNDQYRIEVAQVKEVNSNAFRVRVELVGKMAMGKLNTDTKMALLYHMDSAFYLQTKGHVIYPDNVEPVATGDKNKYDYLVYYSKEKTGKGDVTFYFDDRFITDNRYNLDIQIN
ncbi:MAG: hypothetical protein J0I41_00485 [Filimonas sp.]|nr:hypothetical protein [Filimonas sp.]